MSKGERILLVDDEPANIRLLGSLLSAEGYAVEVATCGESALAQIAEAQPALVLLDVVMPGLSGYDVCRQLREKSDTRLLPVILVTGARPEQERVQGLDAGADEFLTKPVNREELLARVRGLLRVGSLHREIAQWSQTLETRVSEQVAQIERIMLLKNFLPSEVAELVTAEGGSDLIKPQRRDITVCVIDIRGFTAFSDAAGPEQVVEMLGEYFSSMGEIVERHGGTVERFVGDGMVSFFNAPIDTPEPQTRALRAASEMQEAFGPLRARWGGRGYRLGLGIGIASGEATVGAIGFAHRWQYSATGTVTNLAARLCAQARDGQILITGDVLDQAATRLAAESMGSLELRGFSQLIPTFRIQAV